MKTRWSRLRHLLLSLSVFSMTVALVGCRPVGIPSDGGMAPSEAAKDACTSWGGFKDILFSDDLDAQAEQVANALANGASSYAHTAAQQDARYADLSAAIEAYYIVATSTDPAANDIVSGVKRVDEECEALGLTK